MKTQKQQQTYVSAMELLGPQAEMTIEQLAVLAVLHVVGQPEEVMVSISRGRQSVMMEFEVVPPDRGRLIGKNGHTISAIRSLIGAAAGTTGKNYIITVVEDAVDRVAE